MRVVRVSDAKLEAERDWEIHSKLCMSCKKLSKYNGRGGTTENYHGYIMGNIDGRVAALKEAEVFIFDHIKCRNYHEIDGKKSTCLDMVVERLRGDE